MEEVHNLVKTGKSQSVRDALLKLKKDWKTVDRFKYIYYLKHINAAKLKEACFLVSVYNLYI